MSKQQISNVVRISPTRITYSTSHDELTQQPARLVAREIDGELVDERTYEPLPADVAYTLLDSISEPIAPVDERRVIACPTCTAPRDFDDPADCPQCHGTREIVL